MSTNIKEYNKIYYQKNKHKLNKKDNKEYHKEYAKINKDRIKKQKAKYYLNAKNIKNNIIMTTTKQQTITLNGIEYNLVPVVTTEQVQQVIVKPKVQDPNVLHLTVIPKKGERFYWLSYNGLVLSSPWDGGDEDLANLKNHHYYAERNAHLALAIQQAKAELQNIATEINDGRLIDWGDKEQEKWIICYDHRSKRINCQHSYHHQYSMVTCLNHSFENIAKQRMGIDNLKLALEVWK